MSLEQSPIKCGVAPPGFQHFSENLARDPDYLDRLIDEGEAAGFLDHKVKTLQDWRVNGRGPKFIRISARSIKYRRRDLIQFAEERLVSSTSDRGAEAA